MIFFFGIYVSYTGHIAFVKNNTGIYNAITGEDNSRKMVYSSMMNKV